MVYLAVTSAMCLAMPLFMDEMALHWLNVTIAIVVMLYYIYLLQQNTNRDSLTNLLNRQSYYRDIEKLVLCQDLVQIKMGDFSS